MAAGEVEELKTLMRNKFSGEELRVFGDADYEKLASNGFFTAKSFEAATREDLKDALPGRAALVALLVRAFVPDLLTVDRVQPQAGPSTLLSRFVIDADSETTYLDCEYVHAIDLRVHVSTKVYTWKEFQLGKLSKRDDPQVALVKYPPPSFVGSSLDDGWDDAYTGSEHKQHMQEIDTWLGLASGTGFSWLTEGSKSGVKKIFATTIAVGTKNNEVLADPSVGVASAVIGVNIYKRLTWPAILRTHLEYLLWAVTSTLPYMQLLTDMRSGGLFYACNGEIAKRSVIWIVVMEDMNEVKEVFQHFGKNLPRSFNDFSLEEYEQFKTLPHRAKFPYKGATHPTVMSAF